MTQDLISSLVSDLSYRYNHLKETAIFRTLMKVEGEIPSPLVLSRNGRFVRCMKGMDDYEEFQWNEKPMFQIRIRWNETAVKVEVTDMV